MATPGRQTIYSMIPESPHGHAPLEEEREGLDELPTPV